MSDPSIPTAQERPTETVTLGTPIRRGETTIASVVLRKPVAGELRGLSLQDLMNSEVTAVLTVIPRISNPPLTQPEADRLEADDLAEIGGAIRSFFMTKVERVAVEALIAANQPSG